MREAILTAAYRVAYVQRHGPLLPGTRNWVRRAATSPSCALRRGFDQLDSAFEHWLKEQKVPA